MNNIKIRYFIEVNYVSFCHRTKHYKFSIFSPRHGYMANAHTKCHMLFAQCMHIRLKLLLNQRPNLKTRLSTYIAGSPKAATRPGLDGAAVQLTD